MDENKVIQVSDWSQKYKLAIYAISGLGIGTGIYVIYGLLVDLRDIGLQIVDLLSR